MVMWDQGQGVWQIYLSVALYSQNSSRLQNTLATNLYRETWEKLKKIKEKKQTSNCFETADNGSAFAFASYHNCPFVGIHHILDLPIGMLCPKKVPLEKLSIFQKKLLLFQAWANKIKSEKLLCSHFCTEVCDFFFTKICCVFMHMEDFRCVLTVDSHSQEWTVEREREGRVMWKESSLTWIHSRYSRLRLLFCLPKI